MSTINYMSQEGYDRIAAEIEHLKTVGRQEASRAIAEAREKGDLSENAEYNAAKDAQGMLEMKINELDKKMMNVRIIDENLIDTSIVSILTNVRIKNHKINKELIYKIVSEAEADIKLNKISLNSPIGSGLLGKVVGDKVSIKTPAGEMILEVMEITH
ncbi:MAG: transcription elongation factor GreA [Saprospiraceae bacterium]|jgi:transcription elongation factor GreA|nr:transcription elongation factor GreA [Saprospiraceae bacterium]